MAIIGLLLEKVTECKRKDGTGSFYQLKLREQVSGKSDVFGQTSKGRSFFMKVPTIPATAEAMKTVPVNIELDEYNIDPVTFPSTKKPGAVVKVNYLWLK